MTAPRAVIFDLDDTLYLERRFALSGFAAVARAVEAEDGWPARHAFRVLREALLRNERAAAFQHLCASARLPSARVEAWREIYRTHEPRLRLPVSSRGVLQRLRRSWRVGVLTNGCPRIQRGKVAALALEPLVDALVYAHEVGAGKPDGTAFVAACQALGVPPERAVMAGNDPWADIDGARRAGLAAIRIRQGLHAEVDAGCTGPADADVRSITAVPAAADALVREYR